jgi:hypothetical protein
MGLRVILQTVVVPGFTLWNDVRRENCVSMTGKLEMNSDLISSQSIKLMVPFQRYSQ